MFDSCTQGGCYVTLTRYLTYVEMSPCCKLSYQGSVVQRVGRMTQKPVENMLRGPLWLQLLIQSMNPEALLVSLTVLSRGSRCSG